jgi:peptidoglycan/LPS O-acetylase OafA/YrhL
MRRIFPPYLGSIIYASLLPNFFVCLFKLVHLHARWQHFPTLTQYLTHLTFTHTLFPNTWDGIQGSYWSLALEAQLYVAFPLVVWAFRRVGISVLIPMVGASLVYRMIGGAVLRDAEWRTRFLFSVTFLGRWMEFAAGMLAAWIVAQRRDRPISALAGTMLCAAAVAAYSLGVSSRLVPDLGLFPLKEVLLSFAFAATAAAMCVSRTPLRRLLENRLLVFLGLISYSIFLLHQTTMYYFGELLKKVLHLGQGARFTLLVTVGFAITVAVSYVFFIIFERPFLSAGEGRARTAQAPRPADSAQPAVLPAAFGPQDAMA